MAMELAARNLRVLVTAGGSGIGRVIAETFLSAGARVHVSDLEEQALAETKRRVPQLSQTRGDVAKLADVERLFEDVQRALGGLDVLVNNAGIAGPTAKVEDIRPEDWERTIAVDLNGMFYCTSKAMPLLKAAGGGSIINLSSIAGRLAFPMRTPYAAAKWAVVGFTQSLAAEAGPEGVRVNCIQPGIVEGERVERVMEAKAEGLGISKEEVRRRMVEGVSLKTTVTAQDVANTALFLASEAGRHISGQAISVCGGVRYLV
jgi:NAD(P)-dependent dehydrogenase (short-subunit alcohol dehydrogenase family)